MRGRRPAFIHALDLCAHTTMTRFKNAIQYKSTASFKLHNRHGSPNVLVWIKRKNFFAMHV